MDIKKLVRNPSKIHDALVELPEGKLVCKKRLRIYIPVRFEERNLASVSTDIYIVGIYAIVLDDLYYGISLVNAMMRIEPTSTMKIDIDGVGYYEFTFEPGSTITPSVNLVKNDQLVYRIYDEIISKAKVPWYISYSDLGKLFDSAQYHAGANIGNQHEVTELLISLISRDNNNRHRYYRQSIENLNDVVTKPPAYISLRNVAYSATNTTNKLAGSYFNNGVVSALIEKSTRSEKLEKILRR